MISLNPKHHIKKILSVMTAFLAVSCQPRSEQTVETAAPTTMEDTQYLESIDNGPVKWKYAFEETGNPDIEKLYNTAHDIVRNRMKLDKTFKDSSKHLRSWVVLHYPDPAPDPTVMDTPVPPSDTFIVHVSTRKFIELNDWTSVKPLFDLIADDIEKNPSSREDNISTMTALTTIVAFRHERYIHADENETGPVWSDSTLTFDVGPTGSSVVGKSCKLHITSDKIEFSAEDKVFN